MSTSIARGSLVEIHYRLFDKEGVLLESTEDEGAVQYRHGDGDILPGLEKALEGASQGDEVRVTLSPEDAYGEYQPEGLVTVPRSEFEGVELEKGEMITVHVNSDDEDEEHVEGDMDMRVVEFQDDSAVLDANHPLAGQEVQFEVRVISIGEGA